MSLIYLTMESLKSLFAQKNPMHDMCQIVALVPLAMRRTKS